RARAQGDSRGVEGLRGGSLRVDARVVSHVRARDRRAAHDVRRVDVRRPRLMGGALTFHDPVVTLSRSMKQAGFPYPLQESQVMNAWERLVCGVDLPADPARPVIEASLVGCHSAGVDPATTRAPSPTSHEDFSRLLHRFRDVIDVGVTVMEQVRESLSESGTMMILTDPSGVILKTEGDPGTLEVAEDVRLVNGANWDELVCGTNAIGTALSLKEPVQVHATEHFCAGIKPWS